jgi:hypothetical protein
MGVITERGCPLGPVSVVQPLVRRAEIVAMENRGVIFIFIQYQTDLRKINGIYGLNLAILLTPPSKDRNPVKRWRQFLGPWELGIRPTLAFKLAPENIGNT